MVLGSGLIALMFCLTPVNAEWISMDSSGPTAPDVNLVSHTPSATIIDVAVHGFYVEDAVQSGVLYHRLSFGDNAALRKIGRPELPVVTSLVGIPDLSDLKVSIEVLESVTLQGYYVWPAQEMTVDGDETPAFVIDQDYYSSGATYPDKGAVVDVPQIWRDVRVTRLEVRPISHNAAAGELTVATKLRVQIDYSGTNTTRQFTRTRKPINQRFQKLYRGAVINFDQLGYEMDNGAMDNPGVKWLLVCKSEAVPYVQPLFDFRHAQGYEPEIRTIAPDFDTPEEIKAYISTLYATDGLEYVMLVGDAYYSGGPSAVDVPMYYWSNTYSDSWYTMMDGAGDYLADLACGRIVYDTAAELEHQITKTIDYLTDPEVSNWAEHSLLVAHSEQYPQKYTLCKEQIRTYAYAIQTPIFQQCYGGAGATNADVITYLNTYSSGVLNYRGHGSATEWWQWGASGSFNVSHIAQLTNVDRYFVHFDVCCDNMDFPGHNGDCFSESIMKANAAAVATMSAIVPSYTIPNHDFDKEFYKAIYDLGINNIGYASNFANVTVYIVHGSLGESNIRTYLWLGDSAIDVWTNTMQTLTVTHPAVMFLGTNTLNVSVGFEGAMVCAQNDEVYAMGYTDATGSIELEFDPGPVIPGTLTLTVSEHNYLTYQAPIDVIPSEGPYVVYNSHEINDAVVGNNNGQWDFGETTDLSIEVKNVGILTATATTVTITEDDVLVTVDDGSEYYGNIAAGDSVSIPDGFRVTVANTAEDQHLVPFTLTATSGVYTWESYFTLTVNAPVVAMDGLVIEDPTGNNNGALDPGEDTDFLLTVINDGHTTAGNVEIVLTANDPDVTITGSPAGYGNVGVSATATQTYGVSADAGMQSGTIVTFTMDITADNGYTASEDFDILVGDERNMPSGPDNHGYWAWDNNDGGQSNPYNWIEIAPSAGGPGSLTGLTGDDQISQFNLPFNFLYYGQSYSNISISTNGFVCMGSETSSSYSNYSIPSSSGPGKIIALFWDDLNPVYGGQIATYYDATNHWFIVEFYQVPLYRNNSNLETFEMILYDPTHYPTTSGDGIIEVQYHTIMDASSATFGIENQAENDGIEYGYNGGYDVHAWEVEDGRTITYTTNTETVTPDLTMDLTYVSGSPVPAGGGNLYYEIYAENVGATPANFDGWLYVTYQGGPPTTVVQRNFVGFQPGWAINRPNMFFPVSGSYAAGNYRFGATLGIYPTTVYADDNFPFVKSGVFSGGDFIPFVPDGVPSPWDRIDTGEELALPDSYEILGAYPNPFNPTAMISYALPEAGKVTLDVYDVSGRLVRTLVDGFRDAGIHEATFEASGLASGIYLYRLNVADFTATGKMVLMK